MTEWAWVLYAFGLSFGVAAFSEVNRYFQQDGFRLNFWQSQLSVLFLLPVLPLLSWPSDPLFYGAAILMGMTNMIGLTIRFNLAARRNGRVASLYLPISVMAAFVLWLGTAPGAWAAQLSQPWHLLGVLVCFAVMFTAMFLHRQNDASWGVLGQVLPLGIMYAVVAVIGKHALEDIDMQMYTHGYMFLTMASSALVSGLLLSLRPSKGRPLCPPGMLRAAIIFSMVGLFGSYCYLNALSLAPNPGYVMLMSMLAPVWLLFLHKLVGYRDTASPLAGILMLLSAVALVLITQV